MKKLFQPASLGIALLVILFGGLFIWSGAYFIGWPGLIAETEGVMIAFGFIVLVWFTLTIIACKSWSEFLNLFVGLWRKPSG